MFSIHNWKVQWIHLEYLPNSSSSAFWKCRFFIKFRITSLHLSFGLPIFRCPPTSIFHALIHILLSFSPHGLTISVSLLLFSQLCLPHLLALIASLLIFSILIIPIDHPSQNAHLLSNKFCSVLLSVQVALTCIRTGLMSMVTCLIPSWKVY